MIIRTTAAIAFVLLAAAPAEPQTRYDAEAIRLNNRGVAQMGQQLTERAADSFAQAFKRDPQFAQAAVNEGIALLTLQRLDDAKAALKQAIARPEERASLVQPGPGATFSQRTGVGGGQLSASGQAQSPRCRLHILRGRLLPGDEGIR